jgi:hypothetical protein
MVAGNMTKNRRMPTATSVAVLGLADCAARRLLVIPRRGIAIPGHDIVLRVPEIALRFIHFLLSLLLLFDGGEAFRFLVSSAVGIARRIGGLATDEERGATDQANELKVLHMFNHIINRFRL